MYRFYRYKKERPHYNKNMIFYVCSFGGCGSQMICHYLGNFGDVYHIHSRNPPSELKNTGYDDNQTNSEWFSDKLISDADMCIKKYKVLFIYRNPIECIYSRFIDNSGHLKNIQCSDTTVTVEDCVKNKKDLFELEKFFDNYTTTHASRNYDIYAIKYETFMKNIKEFNTLMNIPDIPLYYPEIRETIKRKPYYNELAEIYKSLINKMDILPSIFVYKNGFSQRL